jgi:hypothetical protein
MENVVPILKTRMDVFYLDKGLGDFSGLDKMGPVTSTVHDALT